MKLGNAVSLAGLILEAVGVAIFTYDVFHQNAETQRRLTALQAATPRPVKLKSDRIVSDGFAHYLEGTTLSEIPGPTVQSEIKRVRGMRSALVVGAVLITVGLLLQAVGTAVGDAA